MKVWSLHILILHLLKRQYSWLVTFAFCNVCFNYIFKFFCCFCFCFVFLVFVVDLYLPYFTRLYYDFRSNEVMLLEV